MDIRTAELPVSLRARTRFCRAHPSFTVSPPTSSHRLVTTQPRDSSRRREGKGRKGRGGWRGQSTGPTAVGSSLLTVLSASLVFLAIRLFSRETGASWRSHRSDPSSPPSSCATRIPLISIFSLFLIPLLHHLSSTCPFVGEPHDGFHEDPIQPYTSRHLRPNRRHQLFLWCRHRTGWVSFSLSSFSPL